VLLARIAVSYVAILRLKRRSRPLAPELAERFAPLAGGRRVLLRTCEDGTTPLAVGLVTPAVLLPEWLILKLSEEELRQVVAHELAHLRRRDDWTNLAQQIVEALLWFHPAVWWIGRRLDLEREIACDDWVVSQTGGARPYAACLTRLVELRLLARSPRLAHGATGRRKQITERIEALLNGRRGARPAFSRAVLAGGSAALAAAVLLAGRLGPIAAGPPAVMTAAVAAPRPATIPAAAMRAALAPPSRVLTAVRQRRRTPQPVLAAAVAAPEARRVTYVFFEQWTPDAQCHAAASVCVFYIRGAGQAITILWTQPAPVRVPMKQA
jgi:hypothetical protein